MNLKTKSQRKKLHLCDVYVPGIASNRKKFDSVDFILMLSCFTIYNQL